MASITVDETIKAINEACKTKGGVYKGYSCKTVSWDDVKRGNVGGNLSCWGANITDTYLTAKDGRRLFTVRSDNWNEKLGVVSTSDVAIVQGNQNPESNIPDSTGKNFLTRLFTKNQRDPSGTQSAGATKPELKPITLKKFLENAKQYGSYAGLKTENLTNEILDKKCSIRFQTTFLPVADSDKATLEFATEAYNYNTTSDADPRNLILLCTTQGIALQQDGKGKKKIFHHAVDSESKIHRYWLEAERSKHKVGGEQKESKEEREDAIIRGKATSSVIGIKAMGTRFNVLMTIQIPLAQKNKPKNRSFPYSMNSTLVGMSIKSTNCDELDYSIGGTFGMSDEDDECSDYLSTCSSNFSAQSMTFSKKVKSGWRGRQQKKKKSFKNRIGKANAARVSRGKEVDTWSGLTQANPNRNDTEHITITIVSYFTIAGGVPSEDDVVAAIDDMESLYASCTARGNLADSTFDFMKDELTVKDSNDIAEKILTQPAFVPANVAVTDHSVFPVDDDLL